jgi:hypothetical protein
MKLKERLAEEYCRTKYDPTENDMDAYAIYLQMGFLAGFEAAREMAYEYLYKTPESDLIYGKILELGEEPSES